MKATKKIIARIGLTFGRAALVSPNCKRDGGGERERERASESLYVCVHASKSGSKSAQPQTQYRRDPMVAIGLLKPSTLVT